MAISTHIPRTWIVLPKKAFSTPTPLLQRLHAALVLDEIDEKARAAIPTLQSVMDDKNKYVVRVANRALNQLQGTENIVP